MWGKKKVAVILPTYREKDSIYRVIKEFENTGFIDEIIVIDNNAEEGTQAKVKRTNAKIIKEVRQGLGRAIRTGINNATSDLIIIAEPDGTFKGKDVVKLLSYSDDFEVIFGSRTHQPLIHKQSQMKFIRRYCDVLLGRMISILFLSPPLTDVGCIFRLTSRKAWKKVARECLADNAIFVTQWQLVVVKNKIKFMEIPINFRKRVGVSSITPNVQKQAYWAVYIFFYIWKVWIFKKMGKLLYS